MKRLEQINSLIDQMINEITNPDIKGSLEKLRPKQSFIDKIRKKDISQKEYLEILNSINDIIYKNIIQKYPFSNKESKKINSKLSIALKNFYNFHYCVHFGQDKVKVYPISIDEKTAKEIYKNELIAIIQEHIETGEDYENLMNKRIELYHERVKFYKKALMKLEIVPYYGTPEFMYERALYIVECAKKLPFKTEDLDDILNEMKKFKDAYPVKEKKDFEKCYPYYNIAYKSEYDKFEQLYLKVLEFEETLMPEVSKIWQDYLTDPNNHSNGYFKYIIHTFSEKLVPPNKMHKACCTLATPHLLTIPYGTCGLIYDFEEEAIEAVCPEDAKSWEVDNKAFIERDLPLSWQLTTSNIFYEEPKVSRILLPTELEKIAIANNLVHNQELLNYTNYQAYTEILLNYRARPIGVFYADNCQNIEEVKAYAKRHGLPLIHLSLSELRTQVGLSATATKIEPNKEVNNHLSY